MAPSETVISYNTQPKGSQKPKLQVQLCSLDSCAWAAHWIVHVEQQELH